LTPSPTRPPVDHDLGVRPCALTTSNRVNGDRSQSAHTQAASRHCPPRRSPNGDDADRSRRKRPSIGASHPPKLVCEAPESQPTWNLTRAGGPAPSSQHLGVASRLPTTRSRPGFDLLVEPRVGHDPPELDHGSWHIRIAPQVALRVRPGDLPSSIVCKGQHVASIAAVAVPGSAPELCPRCTR
jgi:hypothetical protein